MKFVDSRSYVFSPHTHIVTLGTNITSDMKYLKASVPLPSLFLAANFGGYVLVYILKSPFGGVLL